jgi:hypothetical protein
MQMARMFLKQLSDSDPALLKRGFNISQDGSVGGKVNAWPASCQQIA